MKIILVNVIPPHEGKGQCHGIRQKVIAIINQNRAGKNKCKDNGGEKQVVEYGKGKPEQVKQSEVKDDQVHSPEDKFMVTENSIQYSHKVIK
jgi:hypothetical protein